MNKDNFRAGALNEILNAHLQLGSCQQRQSPLNIWRRSSRDM